MKKAIVNRNRVTGVTARIFSGLTEKTCPFQPEPLESSQLNRAKPEPEKAGAFQPEPPGNFPVEPEKTGRIFWFRLNRRTGLPSMLMAKKSK